MGGADKDRQSHVLEPAEEDEGMAALSKTRRSLHHTSLAPLCAIENLTQPQTQTLTLPDGDGHEETNLDANREEALDIFLKQPYLQVCRVSPLYNFKYGIAKLKQYALKIKQFITTRVKTTVNINYKTEVRVVDNLKLDANHSDGIMILVWQTNAEGEEIKLLYRGILFSWGYFAAQKEHNVTHLPLLLDNGQNKYVTATRTILSRLFDCIICPMACTQSELLLFSALLSSFSPVNGAKLVTFTYNVPSTKVTTTLNISLEADDIHSWWKSCYEQNNETKVYDINTTKSLYSLFQQYINLRYHLDVAKLEITSLNYPGVLLQRKGILKIRDLEAAKVVFKILCEMSVILRGSVPKLSYDYD